MSYIFRSWKNIILSAFAAGTLIYCPRTSLGQDQVVKSLDFIFGTDMHHIIESEPDTLSSVSQSGITSIRDEIRWSDCEKVKGLITIPDDYMKYVDNAEANGLTVLDILDYSNPFYDNGGYPKSPEAIEGFTKYCEKVVSTFKGKIKYYQIWNEWDGGCEMNNFRGQGDMGSYVKLLSVVYPRIKAIDPSIVVLANAVCSGDEIFKESLKLGVLKCCDGVDLHTYNYQYPNPYEQINIWYTRMLNEDKSIRAANGGNEFPLYVTEMSWPTHIGPAGSTQETSADDLGALYLLSLTLPYLKGVWWYDFCDNGWAPRSNECNFGIVDHDLTPKLSYFVMKDLTRIFKGAHFVERLDAADPDIYILKFKRDDGKWLIAVWSESKDIDWQLVFSNTPQANPKFALSLLGVGTVERAFSVAANSKTPKVSVVVQKRPLILEGDLENVTYAGMFERQFPESERPVIAASKAPDFSMVLTSRYPGIQNGMCQKDVRGILGSPSESILEPASDGSGMRIKYTYRDSRTNATKVIVIFKDDQVIEKHDSLEIK